MTPVFYIFPCFDIFFFSFQYIYSTSACLIVQNISKCVYEENDEEEIHIKELCKDEDFLDNNSIYEITVDQN